MTRSFIASLGLFTALASVPALAGDGDDTFDAPPANGETVTSSRAPAKKGDNHMYVSLRTSAAVPFDEVGVAFGVGISLGAEFADGNIVGLRILGLPSPPAVFGDDTPRLGIGPVVEFGHAFHVTPTMDLLPLASAGFVMGASPQTRRNVILPVLTGGLGVRLHTQTRTGQMLFVTPEAGLSLTALAPYGSVTAGIRF